MARPVSGAKVHPDKPRGSAGHRDGLRGEGLREGTTAHQSDGSGAAGGAKGARPGAAGATAAPAKWSLGVGREPKAPVDGRALHWPPPLFPRAPAWPRGFGRRFWGPAAGATWSPQRATFSRVPRQRSKGRTEWWVLAVGWIECLEGRGEI